MKKHDWKKGIWIPLFLAGVIAVGALLMLGTYGIPTGRILLHIREAETLYSREGAYPSFMPELLAARQDNFTDAIMIKEAAYHDEKPLAYNAFMNPHAVRGDGQDMVGDLLAYADPNVSKSMSPHYYARYWHGYLVFLKPLLWIFTVSQLRMVNMAVQMLLFAAVVMLLGRKCGFRFGLCFAASVVFLNPAATAVSFQFSTVLYVVLLSLLAGLLLDGVLWKYNAWGKLFFLAGAAVSFVDLLTYPVAVPGMLLAVFFLLHPQRIREGILAFIRYGLLWSVGYLGMWAGKWLLATAVSGSNILQDGLDNVRLRTGEAPGGGMAEGIRCNLEVIRQTPLKWFIIVVLIITVLLLVFRIYRLSFCASQLVLLALTACLPFAWYLVANNHSVIHSFFTYRGMMVTVFGILCMIGVSVKRNEIKRKQEDRI